MSKDSEGIGLNEAFSLEGPDDNRRLYASWADTYESGFMEESGYVYHHKIAEIFCPGLEPSLGTVLDVGCGTGVLGQELRRLGLERIVGLDISPEMLAKAGAKSDSTGPIYHDLIEADLTGPIAIRADSYEGLVSSGAFTHGHLGPESLHEVFRVAAPGARCAIGINSAHFDQFGFGAFLDHLVEDGTIAPYDIHDIAIYDRGKTEDPDSIASVIVCTVR